MGALSSAQGGRGQCMEIEAAMAALPFAHHSAMALHFYESLDFLHEHSWLQSSSLLSPQSTSVQPTAALSLGLLSNPCVPSPRPRPHQQTHVSDWGTHGCGTDHLCRSHSVLPATDWLLRSPPSPRSPSSVLADLPAAEGASPDAGTSPLLQPLPRG